MTNSKKNVQLQIFLGVQSRHICPLEPLKETFRLFKQEVSNFFPFLGDNFGLTGSGSADRIEWLRY
jgi:hypothetical protein